MEAEQAADGIDLLDDNFNLVLERLARYKMRAERSFYRAHREIAALQAERRAQAKAEQDEAVRFDKEEARRLSPDTDSPASDA